MVSIHEKNIFLHIALGIKFEKKKPSYDFQNWKPNYTIAHIVKCLHSFGAL